jgi:hypothetical protein
MSDLVKLAVDAQSGVERWKRISRSRATASITGAVEACTDFGVLRLGRW